MFLVLKCFRKREFYLEHVKVSIVSPVTQSILPVTFCQCLHWSELRQLHSNELFILPYLYIIVIAFLELHRGSGLGHALDNMAGMSVRFVDGNAVEKSMDHDKLISSLERGFQNFSGHYGVVQPVRTTVEIKEHNG